ncbi:hypothetical protein EVG20_g4800 [Dentipellis fragilis]|uniref:5'-deoxynucleotidase n=1 Tax=Dentipellis fragilis TaxID=205917 RepID=A0A4Y9YVE9_9AGAM|nr:hypothetical protein EVG20_g4800 [Dentipellis fragilis]
MFALPYASTHKARASNNADIHPADMSMGYHHSSLSATHHSSSMIAGPSSRVHGPNADEAKKEKRRKEIAGRMGKEMSDRQVHTRHYAESISSLHSMSLQLAARPESQPAYTVRLYPLSIERAALLAQLAVEEKNSVDSINAAYELERERVEEEWKRGRDRIRERLLEGIEERRRKAREEKDGEGTVVASTYNSQAAQQTWDLASAHATFWPSQQRRHYEQRSHYIRTHYQSAFALRRRAAIAISPPTHCGVLAKYLQWRRWRQWTTRAKGGGFQVQAVGGLGKSFSGLTTCKESEIESDLGGHQEGQQAAEGCGRGYGREDTESRKVGVDPAESLRLLTRAISISDHMYRMAVLALCSSDTRLDIAKCVMIAIVHDLAEAQVGDIAPREGIPKAEKHRLEAEAMHNFVHDMLHNSPAAQRIEALWKEYEDQSSDEARFVKDLDRFEMATQALEYERGHNVPLQSFFDSSLPNLRHPEVQGWGADLSRQREQAQKEKEHPSSDS